MLKTSFCSSALFNHLHAYIANGNIIICKVKEHLFNALMGGISDLRADNISVDIATVILYNYILHNLGNFLIIIINNNSRKVRIDI